MTSDTFLYPASLETLTFSTLRLTAVETINYIRDDDRDCPRPKAIPTDIRILFRFEICKHKAIYIISF